MSQAEQYETQDLAGFTSSAYLDYSMYVILDRALPKVSDGLKPVQRRIIYAMSELGLSATAKHKKSARTVGDVLGKYHPHGDSACYEAMVLMAQDFSYRYPLIDGQGNWGSPDDPKSFAAMRYTESRMSKHSRLWLDEVDKGCVDWQHNFDGTMKEPTELPSQVPALIINGASGIAVGMATDIPPHNLTEALKATIHLLENPDASTKSLMRFIKGPDYPTCAPITTKKEDILAIYETGSGSIRQRCNWYKDGQDIIIDAIPYQVSPSKVITTIGEMIQNKKLPMITDLRDESDQECPVRLVITVKRGTDVNQLMAFLLNNTDLSKAHRVNMNAIGLDGLPNRFSLRKILADWLEYRRTTVTRRCQAEKDKLDSRIHIIEGLLKAYLNIDEVIRIIRDEDNPKTALEEAFGLTELQSKAILEIRLRQLAKIEEFTLNAEREKHLERLNYLNNVLTNRESMSMLMKDELNEILDSYKKDKDKRNSPLIDEEPPEQVSLNDMMPAEQITLVVSKNEFVRGVKGHGIDPSALSYLKDDNAHLSLACKTNQSIALITQSGRVFNVDASKLPGGRGHGEPLSTLIKKSAGDKLISAITYRENGDNIVVVTYQNGFTAIAEERALATKNSSGKQVFKSTEKIVKTVYTSKQDVRNAGIAYLTSSGRLMIVDLYENGTETFPFGKTGKGLKALNLKADETVIDFAIIQLDEDREPIKIALKNANGSTRSISDDIKCVFVQSRGRTPRQLPKGYGTAASITCSSEAD